MDILTDDLDFHTVILTAVGAGAVTTIHGTTPLTMITITPDIMDITLVTTGIMDTTHITEDPPGMVITPDIITVIITGIITEPQNQITVTDIWITGIHTDIQGRKAATEDQRVLHSSTQDTGQEVPNRR